MFRSDLLLRPIQVFQLRSGEMILHGESVMAEKKQCSNTYNNSLYPVHPVSD
jgi:hypothetical protein